MTMNLVVHKLYLWFWTPWQQPQIIITSILSRVWWIDLFMTRTSAEVPLIRHCCNVKSHLSNLGFRRPWREFFGGTTSGFSKLWFHMYQLNARTKMETDFWNLMHTRPAVVSSFMWRSSLSPYSSNVTSCLSLCRVLHVGCIFRNEP